MHRPRHVSENVKRNSTADEEHSVFVRKLELLYIFFTFSFHLYVFTTVTCGPDDADRQSLVSAALSPFHFCLIIQRKVILKICCYLADNTNFMSPYYKIILYLLNL